MVYNAVRAPSPERRVRTRANPANSAAEACSMPVRSATGPCSHSIRHGGSCLMGGDDRRNGTSAIFDEPGSDEREILNTRHQPRLRVAVVGYGYWGPHLVRNFHQVPDARVHRIVDLSEQRRAIAHLEF